MAVKNGSMVIVMDGGYKDFYSLEGYPKKTSPYQYYIDTAAGTYQYNSTTGTFSTWASGVKYSRKNDDWYTLQKNGDYYNASFETVNMVFADGEVNTAAIKTFVNSCVSLAKIKVTYNSDTNFIFNETNKKEITLNNATEETASFDNTNIYYRGTKQIRVDKITPDSRVANCIKYKVEAVLDEMTNDEVKITSIKITPSGLIFMGGDTDA